MHLRLPLLPLVLALVLGAPFTAHGADIIDDSAALAGIDEARTVVLLDFTSPAKTALYLEVLRGTHQRLVDQGVTPHMVLVFIGPTVQYLTTEPDDLLAMEHGEKLKSIADSVTKLDEKGVRMEVCAVATEVFEVANDTILPEMHVVGDGFISLIGWQSQGYKLVPIF